ncbi:hypothetical protein BD626DRAFT_165551 [Schizophyllum amplum]|uniref:Uncharacterized protein n=1 Tax=Schizophyllum amplum TaxID=97359 RepID=A0A550CPX4_9AGAR|nr:hypothetical protein BD626DRAFT_165551 [Auriculariopsis ampla]
MNTSTIPATISATEAGVESLQYSAPFPYAERKTAPPPYTCRAPLPIQAGKGVSTRKLLLDGFQTIQLADDTVVARLSTTEPPSSYAPATVTSYPPADLEAAMHTTSDNNYRDNTYPDEKHPSRSPRQVRLVVPMRQTWLMHPTPTRSGALRKGIVMGSWAAVFFLIALATICVFTQL